jgi:hypothetical protein
VLASGFFNGRLVLERRLLRAFDSEWLDTAYAVALTPRLAALPPD